MMLSKRLIGNVTKLSVVLSAVSLLVACSSQPSGGSSASKGGGKSNKVNYTKDVEVSVDAAREITVTKTTPYVKLPQLPGYEPKKLNEEARGIAVAYSVPYTCKLLGEVEGKDSADGKIPPSFEDIREGATNDLRNRAAELVDDSSRLLLKLTKEAMTCEMKIDDSKFEERDCTTWNRIPQSGKILSYRIHANVFECGSK